MKTIKIAYAGWWNGFDYKQYSIQRILEKYYKVEISEKPDYLFYSVFSPVSVPDNTIMVEYIGENLCPDFNVADYAIGFEKLSFQDRYLYRPNWLMNPKYATEIDLMQKKHLEICHKEEFCSFVYSNAEADPFREAFFEELCKYKKVNSGGRYLNNIGVKEGVANKLEFQRKHKFSIAFENSSHVGYVTEKIVQSFAAGTIPIYWGDPQVGSIFNEKAFVNVHKFQSIDAVIEEIKKIDENDDLYISMLTEPALKEIDYIVEQEKKVEEFLRNIVEQDKQKAIRKPMGIWGERCRNELRHKEEAKKPGFFSRWRR